MSTSLPETTLVGIIRNRQLSTTGEPLLMLVCQQCMYCFPYNYHNRKAMGLFVEPLQTPSLPFYILVVADCDNGNCAAQVEIIAIRPHGTTEEQFLAERPLWDLGDVYCGGGHPIIAPR
ncbi:MAG TPA: hypothetical protein VII95_11630 [Terriglobales bacterium]